MAIAAYAAPAVVVWAVVGLGLNVVSLSRPALVALVAYTAAYGLIEAAERLWMAAPQSNWQVPSTWVIGVSSRRRVLVWGALLGPGFATRNAYAGFGALILTTAAIGGVWRGMATAAAIGLAHGSGRAISVSRDARSAASADYLQTTIKKMQWRRVDGIALLALAGAALAALARGF